jgi:hypothetical protein
MPYFGMEETALVEMKKKNKPIRFLLYGAHI